MKFMDRGFIKKRLIFCYSLVWVFLFLAIYVGYAAFFVDLAAAKLKWLGFFASGLALLYGVCKISESVFCFYKDNFIEKLSKYFSSGTKVFSFSRNSILFLLTLVLVLIATQFLGMNYALAFALGVILTLVGDCIPRFISVQIMPRIYRASKDSLNYAFKLALNSGIISSLFMVGFALFGVCFLYSIYKDCNVLYAFLFGVSLIVLLNTAQSAIVKKASTDATCVIAKFDSNIIENDKRNPILLLKGIAKTALEFSSRLTDGFQSYVAILVASVTIGVIALNNFAGVYLPLMIACGGVFCCVFVLLVLKMTKTKNPAVTLYYSCFMAVVLIALLSYLTFRTWFADYMAFYKIVLIGIFLGYLSNFVNFNYIYDNQTSSKNVANASISGISTVLIQTLKEGFMAALCPVLLLGILIVVSFLLAEGLTSPVTGIFGVSLCACGFASSFILVCTILGFGFVSDNYNNLAESFEQNLVKEENTLSCKGFSLVALSENFMNMLACVSVVLLFIAYSTMFELWQIDILNPYVMFSVLIGSLVSFSFCAALINETFRQTKNLSLEAKRQFKTFPQILRYEMGPDFDKVVKISAMNSTFAVILFIVVVTLVCALIAYYLKMEAVGGFFAGLILPSIILIFLCASASNVVRSAKRIFSDPNEETYILNQADEILTSIKDIIVPNLKSLIKFLIVLAITVVPLFV